MWKSVAIQLKVEVVWPFVSFLFDCVQVYHFPSRALLNPEKDAGVLQDQEICIEPMRLHNKGNLHFCWKIYPSHNWRGREWERGGVKGGMEERRGKREERRGKREERENTGEGVGEWSYSIKTVEYRFVTWRMACRVCQRNGWRMLGELGRCPDLRTCLFESYFPDHTCTLHSTYVHSWYYSLNLFLNNTSEWGHLSNEDTFSNMDTFSFPGTSFLTVYSNIDNSLPNMETFLCPIGSWLDGFHCNNRCTIHTGIPCNILW